MAASAGGSGRQTLTEINVTPLVDVMLVLLIIFMVTAPLIQQGVEVKLPEVRAKAIDAEEQKLVLSKWFIRNCHVYIFDEPTRGIDVGAKIEIYRLMHELAARGAGIIMVSSELHEVMNISDRIAVVWSGRIVREFARGEASDEQVMSYALGLHEQRAS